MLLSDDTIQVHVTREVGTSISQLVQLFISSPENLQNIHIPDYYNTLKITFALLFLIKLK